MLILQIAGGVLLGLLALGLLSVLRKAVDRVSCRITTGFDLHRNPRTQADWRILQLSTDQDFD